MANTEYVLRQATDGSIWAHRVKKNGTVSAAGGRVSTEEAARMVSAGEAAYEQPVKAAEGARGQSYEEYIQELADAGGQINPKDYDAVMNRDY